jgi:chromosome segregation protein
LAGERVSKIPVTTLLSWHEQDVARVQPPLLHYCVRLTSLTINGFKSFGDKTTIEFSEGVTGIVGPNGSGKSNVIDALKWAMGGGRASEFRAPEKTDLIFHGAAGKKSIGYAEVELTLKSGRQTINIGRSLFRDGNTKLRLNGQSARFVDIDEAISGSGLGRGGVSIIGQGEVSGVLMADPEKLLGYVAEAAGVAKLAARREQAQDRLETAKEHLERVSEMMQTLAEQVERLKVEAAQAQRHTELTKEALQLRYTLAVQREQSLSADVKELQVQEAVLTDTLEQGKEHLVITQGRWHELRQTLAGLEETYRVAVTEAEAKRGDVRVAEERVNALTEQQTVLTREIANLRTEMLRLEALEEPRAPGESLTELGQIETDAHLRYQALQQTLNDQETQLKDEQQRLESLRRQLAGEEQAQATYLSKREQLGAQLVMVESRLASLAAVTDLEPLAVEVNDLTEQVKRLEHDLEAKRTAFLEAQQRHAKASAEADAFTRAAQKARAEFEARRGYAQGPKHALTSGIPGIHGSVADLLRVPDDYKQAVASALGRRSEYVVVDTAQTGQDVLAHVKRMGGWVTVLPLDLIKSQKATLANAISGETGVIGLAVDVVDFQHQFEQIFYQLFGNTTLIETMSQAVATLEGETLEGYGAMTGGQNRVSISVLGAASEVEEVETDAAKAQQHSSETRQTLDLLQSELQTILASQQVLMQTYQEKTQTLAKLREEQAINASLQNELAEQRLLLAQQLESLIAPLLSADAGQLETLEQTTTHLQANVLGKRGELATATEQYQEARQTFALAVERSRQYELEMKRFEGEQQRLTQVKDQWLESERRAAVFQEQAKEAQMQLEIARAALPKDIEEKRLHLESVRQETRDAETSLNHLTESQAHKAKELEETRVTLGRREAALEIAREEKKNFPEGLTVLDMSNRAARDRLGYAEKELADIGPVNHRATIELQEQQTKLDDLEIQTVQATLAVTELEAALQKIDEETTVKLTAAILQLRQNFKQYAAELFGPTVNADIETQDDNGRPIGISIRLQPPGKQTTSLTLLSVGERTMGAMAFLFSLMQGDGTQRLPMAILDEVDAPLDEANIRRYCQFLSYLAKQGTQFILITHQKATFEVADVLWGVTSDRGVSRVFSIAKRDYVAA